MCGIAGSFPVSDKHAVRSMMKLLRHRGPDDGGLMANEDVCLGHRRLSIMDVEGGHQPLANENGKVQIVFNGEIYNHPRLRATLPQHRFKTRTDTEVIVHLYEDAGPRCVNLLDGMFAFALHDGKDLFLTRDALGIKPLYFALADGATYFASEIKALLPISKTIHEFPAGTFFHSQRGFHRYFELKRQRTRHASVSDWVHRLRTTLEDAVRKRMMADVPVGVCLSGGLDSSVIAMIAKRLKPDLKTFSVGMEGSEDVAAARMVADFLGTQHYEYVYTAEEIREVLPRVIYHLESFDPALVRSAVANYFLARLASQHVKVALCGEGADELFSGYDYLKKFGATNTLTQELQYITNALHNTNLQRVDRMTMAFGLEGRVPYLDVQMVKLAFQMPPDLKLHTTHHSPLTTHQTEKWILRKAFENDLPSEIVWRRKEKFAYGCGSAETLKETAERCISDNEFERERRITEHHTGASKEELYYYRLFRLMFPDEVVSLVGRSRSL